MGVFALADLERVGAQLCSLFAALLNDSLDRLRIAVKVYGVAITKNRVVATVTTLVASVTLRYVTMGATMVGL
jgi:alanine-alpha-ketoisovalerate/valine-pyruvate aminotransferase